VRTLHTGLVRLPLAKSFAFSTGQSGLAIMPVGWIAQQREGGHRTQGLQLGWLGDAFASSSF